jgi:RNA polymerase sigma-70 factor (ECF subfamily)
MDREDASDRPPSAEATADTDLVTALVRGDRQALGTLYDRHAGALLTLAVRLVGARAQAEELLHDVFLEAWHHARDFDPARGSVRAWLIMRTRSRALDRRAAESRQVKLAQRASAERIDVSQPERASQLDAGRVRRGLGRLPAELVAIVEAAYFEGLSSSEIASLLAIPIGTVKSRMARALSLLREEMGIGGTGGG